MPGHRGRRRNGLNHNHAPRADNRLPTLRLEEGKVTANPNFYFDEIDMAGIDYCSPEVGRDYDQGHQRFRDYEAEANEAIELLGLDETSLVLDMGAGTGAFALHAARRCAQVIAVDISPSMLQWCREKADQMGLTNLTIVQAGFLSYRHEGPPVNAAISNVALHHLPDHWKQTALNRLAAVIEPGGRLLLQDVVFPSGRSNLDQMISGWLDGLTRAAGPEMGQEAVVHIRNEFSTFDWVMEGMLRRAGFGLESVGYRDGFLARYLCRKN